MHPCCCDTWNIERQVEAETRIWIAEMILYMFINLNLYTILGMICLNRGRGSKCVLFL